MKPWKTYDGRDSSIGGAGKQPLGDRLSAAIVRVTGSQPCWGCKQVVKAVNALAKKFT